MISCSTFIVVAVITLPPCCNGCHGMTLFQRGAWRPVLVPDGACQCRTTHHDKLLGTLDSSRIEVGTSVPSGLCGLQREAERSVPGPTCVPPKWDERKCIIIHRSYLVNPLAFGTLTTTNCCLACHVASADTTPLLLRVKPFTFITDFHPLLLETTRCWTWVSRCLCC